MTDVGLAILHDPIGRWFLYFGALIALVLGATVVARRVSKRLDRIGDDLGLVKHEVKNNHPTNLREEADVRHDENASKLDRLDAKTDTVLDLVAGLQRGQGRLYDLIVGNTERIDDMEKTINPKETS